MIDQLSHKIKELFYYRKLPQSISLSKKSQDEVTQNQFLNHLEVLQRKIYELDYVLESSFEVSNETLKLKWKEIYNQLTILGIPVDKHDLYCSDIYRYQKHELSLREGKYILQLPMEQFYYFKSCDVKLIRRLIYERYSDLHDIIPLEKWIFFDLITEVNDDVEDIYEDINSINGNRFLLEVQAYGIETAVCSFQAFLSRMDKKYFPNLQKSKHRFIEKCTKIEMSLTQQLLHKRHEEIATQGLMHVQSPS